MKAIAYTALHYGAPYLAYAIHSVIDYVQEYHVLYSPNGSHGTKSQLPIPSGNTEHELHAIAQRIAGDKLHWHVGDWQHEGQQRDSIYTLAPDADVVLTLDADEIWPQYGAAQAIRYALNSNARIYRAPMIHFWRSFNKAVLHDPAFPERIVVCHRSISAGYGTLPTMPIAHMGYAQQTELIAYKAPIHGHRAEWRKLWFDMKWCINAQEDVHPTNHDYWYPETVDPLKYLPDFMRLHPYYGLDIIE